MIVFDYYVLRRNKETKTKKSEKLQYYRHFILGSEI